MWTPVQKFWLMNDESYAREIEEILYPQHCAIQNKFLYNTLLYGVNIRQLMVHGVPCSGKYNVGNNKVCFPSYSRSKESMSVYSYGTFVASNNSYYPDFRTNVFSWEQSLSDSSSEIDGEFASYPGSGFSVDLPVSETSSWYTVRNMIHQYQHGIQNLTNGTFQKADVDQTFVQPGTRAVIVSLNFYNPSVDLYTHAEFLLERLPTALWKPSSRYFVAPNPNYPLASFPQEVASLVFAILTWVYILLWYVRFFRNFNWYRLGTFWTLFDLAALVLYGLILDWTFRYYFVPQAQIHFPDAAQFKSFPSNPFWVCGVNSSFFKPCGGQVPNSAVVSLYTKEYHSMQLIFASVIFLAFATLLRHAMHFGGFVMLSKAGRKGGKDLFNFFVICVLIFVGYVLAGHLFYGPVLVEFSTVRKSFTKMILFYLRTHVDYYVLYFSNDYAQAFTPIFVFSFYILFNFVFTCVILAIVHSAWQGVKEAAYKEEREQSLDDKRVLDLIALYTLGNEIEAIPVKSAKSHPSAVTRRMIRDKTFRRKGCSLLCEWFCARTRTGFVSKEFVRINLIEWKRQSENRDVHFVDTKLLRDALRGVNKNRTIKSEQVQYYFNVLSEKTYSKLEVDQLDAQIELAQRAFAGKKKKKTGVSAELSGPSLTMRDTIFTTFSNVSIDHKIWLASVDKYIASLRVQQGRSVELFNEVAAKVRHALRQSNR
mmetsp:Transcript_9545/g.20725  ORF Transcript_9545/g.20725 Transcript_9545/m.20725 type:complete len:708 (-) Transcript_9545:2154-4277(-)